MDRFKNPRHVNRDGRLAGVWGFRPTGPDPSVLAGFRLRAEADRRVDVVPDCFFLVGLVLVLAAGCDMELVWSRDGYLSVKDSPKTRGFVRLETYFDGRGRCLEITLL